MTTGRINQISIGAGSKRQKRFEKGLLGLRFHLAVFFCLGDYMLIDWVCFVFFGFWVWIKKQRNKGDVLQLNAGTRLLFDYLLTSFSGWNPSGRGKNRTVLRFVPVRWSCVHSTKFQLRLKKKNSQPTSESRHERNDVINGKPLKNTQAEDEKVCCSRNLDQGLVREKKYWGAG